MDERALRDRMCEVGRLLWDRQLIGGTEGNMSARLSFGRLLSTPAGACKGLLKPDDLVVLNADGRVLGSGEASSEIRLHVLLMAERRDCDAVVHAHPITATAYGTSEDPLPDDLCPEAFTMLGPIARVPFAMPGTDELPRAVVPFAKDHKTFLLSHHGAVTLGSDLMDAFFRMDALERICRLALTLRLLGSQARLPKDVADRLRAQAGKF